MYKGCERAGEAECVKRGGVSLRLSGFGGGRRLSLLPRGSLLAAANVTVAEAADVVVEFWATASLAVYQIYRPNGGKQCQSGYDGQ